MANHKKAIVQYDFNLNVVHTFDSIYEALELYDIPGLYNILKRDYRKAYGFYWSYSNIDITTEKRLILVVDRSFNELGRYTSIKEASDDMCINCKDIFNAIMNGSPRHDMFFINITYDKSMQQIVELNENYELVHIYDRLYDISKNAKQISNKICYACTSGKQVNGKYYARLDNFLTKIQNLL